MTGNEHDFLNVPECDPFDSEHERLGPTAFATLAMQAPLARTCKHFDLFVASDPDYIRDVLLRDTSIWTSELGVVPTEHPKGLVTRMMQDNSGHLKIRRIIQRGFSPSEIKRLAAVVEEILAELFTEIDSRSEPQGDFFELLAMPLPSRLMCRMLGVPETEYPLFKDWADRYFYSINNDPSKTGESRLADMQEVSQTLFKLIGERRKLIADKKLRPDVHLIGKELPNDFLSRFMCEQIEGEFLNDVEILSLMSAVILGANETTRNLIGNLLTRLLEVPERWESVKANPALIEVAIEESLRLDPPVLGMCRTPRHDVVVSGFKIPAETKTFYNISAVNRDPKIWDSPDEFRLDRPLNLLKRHASFSGGERLCLGASLVRMEVKMLIEKLVTHYPNLRLVGEPKKCPGFNVWGKTTLPVAW
jgi:cytochrome P450